MEGVMILKEYSYNDYNSEILVVLLFVGFFCILTSLVHFNSFKKENSVGYKFFVIGFCFIAFATFLENVMIKELENVYDVAIMNESVSFKEFSNMYEIISVDGEIYTVRKRDSEEHENEN